MPRKNMLSSKVITTLKREFPVYTEEDGSDESVPIETLVRRIAKGGRDTSSKGKSYCYASGYARCLLDWFALTGLLEHQDWLRGMVKAKSFEAYGCIRSMLEMQQSDLEIFRFDQKDNLGHTTSRELVEKLERRRLAEIGIGVKNPIRVVNVAIGIVKARCSSIGKDVFLFYRKRLTISHKGTNDVWLLPGGKTRLRHFEDIKSIKQLSEYLNRRSNGPETKYMINCLKEKISDQFHLTSDSFEICDLKNVNTQFMFTALSERQGQYTQYRFFPFHIKLHLLPKFDINIEENSKWFTSDAATLGLDSSDLRSRIAEGAVILFKRLSEERIIDKIDMSTKLDIPRNQVVDVRGESVESFLDHYQDDELIMLEGSGRARGLNVGNISTKEISRYKSKYDIFIYDPERMISLKGNEGVFKGGHTEEYYAFLLMLFRQGDNWLSSDLLEQVKSIMNKNTKDIQDLTMWPNRIVNRIKASLSKMLPIVSVERFVEKGLRGVIVVRSEVFRTCVIITGAQYKKLIGDSKVLTS
ncbi:hypothetical protein HY405_00365 [Candidatus Microgenomates bacterium]|nr:hypothetical protein [Candidatus Microgenomates bacterium]